MGFLESSGASLAFRFSACQYFAGGQTRYSKAAFMMVFRILPFFVPLVVFFLLPALLNFTAPGTRTGNRLLLAAGCSCYLISWFLPSPLIEGEDTQFTTHFVGGGIFTGFIWLYLVRQLGWNLTTLLELISLQALVSALGVANELFEFVMTKSNLLNLTPCDTWWDLLANSAGALAFWVLYRAARAAFGYTRSKGA
jgi:hypothetical protein